MDQKVVTQINEELGLDIPVEATRKELVSHLEEYINELIGTNFNQFIQVLYRIDISEKKLKDILSENPNEDAARIITQMILQRQQEKVKSKRDHKTKDSIPEDEK